MPKVFISYSHDSDEHRAKVLAFANQLRKDGIESILDQYLNGAPSEGWPLWMEQQIEASQFVLIVCTETYLNRVQRKELSGKGQGVKWESLLTYNHIYNNDSMNAKFIPILLREEDRVFIPVPLIATDRFIVTDMGQYDSLYRRLTNQPNVIAPEIGTIRTLPKEEVSNFFDKTKKQTISFDQKKKQTKNFVLKEFVLTWPLIDESSKMSQLELILRNNKNYWKMDEFSSTVLEAFKKEIPFHFSNEVISLPAEYNHLAIYIHIRCKELEEYYFNIKALTPLVIDTMEAFENIDKTKNIYISIDKLMLVSHQLVKLFDEIISEDGNLKEISLNSRDLINRIKQFESVFEKEKNSFALNSNYLFDKRLLSREISSLKSAIRTLVASLNQLESESKFMLS